LNLTGTNITSAGLIQLKELKKLKKIYLYKTGIEKSGWAELVQSFPNAILDSGGYQVPMLPTDTVILKKEK
jgi:hypothetical protein